MVQLKVSNAASKAVAKKTVAPKKRAAVKKVVAKKITKVAEVTKAKKESVSKIKKAPPLASKKEVTKNLEKDVRTLYSTKSAPKLQKIERRLTIPSPFRFPLDLDVLAKNSARYGGVFFVAIGAFFTLLYSSYTFSAANQLALLGGVLNTSTNVVTEVQDCATGLISSPQGCVPNIPAISRAVINIPGSSVFKDTIKVEVEVENADYVLLSAFSKTAGRSVEVGQMNKTSDAKWVLNWDTTQFDDGAYVLKVFAKNAANSYEIESKTVTLENHPFIPATNTVTSSDSSVQDGVASSDATSSEETQHTELTEETSTVSESLKISTDKTSPFEGTVKLSVNSSSASKVNFYVTSASDGSTKLVGNAFKKSDGRWYSAWDTKKYVDGVYKVTALIIKNASEYKSEALEVTVLNAETNTSLLKTGESIVQTPVEMEKIQSLLNPHVAVSVAKQSPISGNTEIRIVTENPNYIELYATNKKSATQSYLGKARKLDTGLWVFDWNTKNTPNGEIKITAKVQNKYGIFEGQSDYIVVSNNATQSLTENQVQVVERLQEKETVQPIAKAIVDQVFEKPISTTPAVSDSETDVETRSSTASSTKPDVAEIVTTADTIAERVAQKVATYNTEVNSEMQKLASAIRVDDQNSIDLVKARITDLKDRIADSVADDADAQTLKSEINSKLDRVVERVQEDVQRSNKLIEERTSLAISTDSDDDGITDYDEINIYSTDPFSADTDNDGFIDGAEILRGYNPKDAKPEAAVVFESPKESGIVREDILTVDTITTAVVDEETFDNPLEIQPKAIIAGKALPNSYVTLYIFSTPVVVTVKTDEDGSWSYKFDKELEDGEHEVYVGVTDNAGKIIAKSNPLIFVKEAQAFSEVDSPVPNAALATGPQKSFVSEYMVYLILSISVAAIGLVLILLGLHVDTRQKLAIEKGKQSATV